MKNLLSLIKDSNYIIKDDLSEMIKSDNEPLDMKDLEQITAASQKSYLDFLSYLEARKRNDK